MLVPDNFHFDIQGVSLDVALPVAMREHETAIGFRIKDDVRPAQMILYWVKSDRMTAFPAPVGIEDMKGLILSWLRAQDYGPEPDIDGSTGKGFRIYNETWGHVEHEYQAFAAIQPMWNEYGK